MERRDIERYVYVFALILYGLYSIFSRDMPGNTVDRNTVYILFGVTVALGILTLLRHQSGAVLFGLNMFYGGVLQLYIFFGALLVAGPYRKMLPFGDMAILFVAGVFCTVGGYRLILFALEDFGQTEKVDFMTRERQYDADNSTLTVEWALYCFGVPVAVLFYIYIMKDGARFLSMPDFSGMKTLYILAVVVPSLYLLAAGVVSFFRRRFPVILYGGYLLGLGGAFLVAVWLKTYSPGHFSSNLNVVQFGVGGLAGLFIGLRLIHLGLKENRSAQESAAGAHT